jgi:hypothetical protein
MTTKYEILKCDPTPAGGWIVRMRASDPSLSGDIFVEKESVLTLPSGGGDPVEGALTAVRDAGWKDVLDRKLSSALSAAGLLAAPRGQKLAAPREVVL